MPIPAIIPQIAGAVLGIGLGNQQSQQNMATQYEYQRKLMKDQQMYNERNMGINYGHQLKMWKDTNYAAQIEQLKLAGLNPGLLYGMSGGGGATTGGGGTPSNTAPGAPDPTSIQSAMLGMGLQLGQQAAQTELIKSQTEKTKAETEKISGVDTEKGKTEVKSLLQGIENAKAQKELTEIETSIKQTEQYVKQKTQNAAIAIILQEMREGYERMEILKNEGIINDATMNEKIGIMEQQLIKSQLENELQKAQITKTTTETENISNNIHLVWHQLKNEQDKTKIQQQLANFETSFGKQASDILKSLLGTLQTKR